MSERFARAMAIGGMVLMAPAVSLASAPATATRPADLTPFILTPTPPATPRINGPTVFAVRPGSPLIYSIPATGERPMAFSADALPQGLQLDASTGRINGTLRETGEHIVTLRARNSVGAAEKKFRIVCGEELALTPPLGWNSYNSFGLQITQDKALRAARALVASGLSQHGWTYINLDDGWQGTRGGPRSAIQPDPARFTDIRAMCDDIHALGLKVGIYSTPWVTSYGRRVGGSSENPQGTWDRAAMTQGVRNQKALPYAIGKYHFATQDARQWAEWGIDYLKYDWGPVEAEPAKEMADALRATGRDIVLSLSNNAAGNLFNDIAEVSKYAQAWRITGDIRDNWTRLQSIGFSQDKWAPFERPGHYNDTDMLVVGVVGFGGAHPSNLTADEQYTHISLWCLLSAPLLIGCDLEKLDPFTLNLLTNDEVLAIDQDPLCKQATRIARNGDIEVYAKSLEDASWAVGLFNRGPQTATGAVEWKSLGLTGQQTVRDLWRQKDLGVLADKFEASVPSHGVVLVRIVPAK